MRKSVNRQTGYTLNKLMLGQEVNTLADIVYPSPKILPEEDTDLCVKDLVKNMKKAHNTARAPLKTSQRIMKAKYDFRVLKRPYQEGDVVYLLGTVSVKGKCKKLLPPWKGPARITKRITSALFKINLRNALFVVNHDRIKVSKGAKIRIRYNQVPHPTQDTNGKVKNSVIHHKREPRGQPFPSR